MTTETKTESAAAPAIVAPAAEPAKTEVKAASVDHEAEAKSAKKALDKALKDAESARKQAEDSNAKLSALAEALGVGKKADPVEAAQSQLAAAQQRSSALEQRIAKAAAVEAIRRDFADVEDPNDVLALIGGVPAIAQDTLEIADPDAFKTGVAALLEKKPYLRKKAADPRAAPGGVLPHIAPKGPDAKPEEPQSVMTYLRRNLPGRSTTTARA